MKDAFEFWRAGPSSSSMALSSTESERSETLARRPKGKGEAWVGEVPDRPSVEIETRRWFCAVAVEMGPGNGPVGPPVLLDRPKMELKVWVVKEPRRFWEGLGAFSSLPDIVSVTVRRGGGSIGDVGGESSSMLSASWSWRCRSVGVREICRDSPQLLSSASGGVESAVTQVEVVCRPSSCLCCKCRRCAEDSFVDDSAGTEAVTEAGRIERSC